MPKGTLHRFVIIDKKIGTKGFASGNLVRSGQTARKTEVSILYNDPLLPDIKKYMKDYNTTNVKIEYKELTAATFGQMRMPIKLIGIIE